MSTTTPLATGWTFRNAKSSESHSVARVPSEIFVDLLAHSLIPDPFVGKNERAVQWVGEEDWVYEVTFPTPAAATASGQTTTHLVFEGLDTYATVTLNGKVVLKCDNMFTPQRVNVGDVLKGEGEENRLSVLFESAYLKGRKIVEKWPEFAWGCWNGDKSRLAVRKAQYHYGWDWGPMLMSAGPWRPVYLESYIDRIEDLYFTAEVSDDLSSATVKVTAEVEGDAEKIILCISSPKGKDHVSTVDVKDGKATTTFTVKKPALWYPHGYGEQPLYTVRALIDSDISIAQQSKRMGLRRACVVQRPLKDVKGSCFFFEINNIPMWCGGSNWIPADNFLTRVTEDKYRRWLELVKDGRQVMVRVWAGGIYEDDKFYDICDELGLMVWQDFAFGCGNYPAMIPEFRESVRKEATVNVKRLRHHPSIVIYAGNNEDYSYMWGEPNKLGYDAADTNPENWLKTQFPARYIYEKILPEVVAEHSPLTEYHRGSPYGNEARPDGGDYTIGDTHQWNVWHGTQEPYQDWDKLSARFVSEFGMASFPSIEAIDSFLTPETLSERNAFSSTVEHHNKADGAERRIALYLAENITFRPTPLEAYIYSTQLMQSDALTSAYRTWRRNWQGPGKELTSGALVWQINDCWPVTSWAIVDSLFRPKLAYFGIKRELAPIILGARRTVVVTPADKYTAAHTKTEHKLQVWMSSFLPHPSDETYKLVAKSFHANTGELLAEDVVAESIPAPHNRAIELADVLLPGWTSRGPADDSHLAIVTALYLLPSASSTAALADAVARTISWPDPLKHVPLSRSPGLGALHWQGKVKVRTQRPVKGLQLLADGEVQWEDNGVDVVPGEVVEVGVTGLDKVGGAVGVRFLGNERGGGVALAGQGVWEAVKLEEV
ncbi:putative beta-mannosidase B [Geopyxis carbonaria]|nr:putative beta-mannosidase B [Geopyxis carbonaria]